MGFIKLFDAVEMVIDEATKKFSPTLKEDVDKKDTLREVCKMVEALEEQFNDIPDEYPTPQFGDCNYEVEIDERTKEISISVVCAAPLAIYNSSKEEIEKLLKRDDIDYSPDTFYWLCERAKKIRLKGAGEDLVKITFVFDGIWVKT